MKKEYIKLPLEALRPYENNPRDNTPAVEPTKASIEQVGYINPIIVDEDNVILAGHTRLLSLTKIGGVEQEVDVLKVSGLTEEQKKKYRLLDNKTAEYALWDFDMLHDELEGLDFDGYDFGFPDLEIDIDPINSGALADKFLVPPFSVIHTTRGAWPQRKKYWLDFGIRSEIGRGDKLVYVMPNEMNRQTATGSTGTSVFDPALCELMYRWFSCNGDFVLDPFAGGSVRGIVGVELGRHYCGVDLRAEQVEANRANAEEICTDECPTWVCGDSCNITTLAQGEYDFMLTCPPYGDLEQYSDDPNDLSNMDAEDFDNTYREILNKTVSMLRDDRFACVVVGNYRDKKGNLRDLVGLTVDAMEQAGAKYYNDIILVTPAGSLPVRTSRQFPISRKVGRQHQYVLIFLKGDAKAAVDRLGDVELPDMDEYEEE